MKRSAFLLCAVLLVACADDAKEVGDPSARLSAAQDAHIFQELVTWDDDADD